MNNIEIIFFTILNTKYEINKFNFYLELIDLS